MRSRPLCEPISRIYCDDCGTFLEEPCLQHAKSVTDKPVIPYAVASLPDVLYLDCPDLAWSSPSLDEKVVFARSPLASNTIFGPLVGSLSDTKPAQFDFVCGSAGKSSIRYFQLESHDTSNWMKFVRFAATPEEQNVAVYEAERSDQAANCASSVIFVTTRAIAEHEELKIGYSVDYARIIEDLSGKCVYKKRPGTVEYVVRQSAQTFRKAPASAGKNVVAAAKSSTREVFSVPPAKRPRLRRSDHRTADPPDNAMDLLPSSAPIDDGLPSDFQIPPELPVADAADGDDREDSVESDPLWAPSDESNASETSDEEEEEKPKTKTPAKPRKNGYAEKIAKLQTSYQVQETSTLSSTSIKPRYRSNGYDEKIAKLKQAAADSEASSSGNVLVLSKSQLPFDTGHGTVLNLLPSSGNGLLDAVMAPSLFVNPPAEEAAETAKPKVPRKPGRPPRNEPRPPVDDNCRVCGEKLLSGSRISHMWNQHPEYVQVYWKFECPECLKRLPTGSMLKQHVQNYHANQLRTVSEADRTSALEYMQRMNRYHCFCDTCGVRYPTVALLDLHSAYCEATDTNTDNGERQCPACEFLGDSAETLLEHLSEHAIRDGDPNPCLLCGCSAKFPGAHFRTRHPEEYEFITAGLPFECDQCGKRYPNAGTLAHHAASHSGAQWQCMYCIQHFPTANALSKHNAAAHVVDGQYPCPRCDKAYETYKQVRKHFTNYHDLAKSRYCPLCDKLFDSYAMLSCHMSKHPAKERGVRPVTRFLGKKNGKEKRWSKLDKVLLAADDDSDCVELEQPEAMENEKLDTVLSSADSQLKKLDKILAAEGTGKPDPKRGSKLDKLLSVN
ncbi:zinc finger protein 768-like [Paramacrobiotus metropolitanus]|uniref:zinc finger protein 768-like n=1 Tax=Paramacrobiotus metropolitanus TaxID=2943436 RepID=UPI002445C90B|nr:zinc finger protein 768-like [Paramacrobiotus metropolitanus]XP_055334212.1 zinc finger protein 768-like [Paramacrobiotus metropolitanus]